MTAGPAPIIAQQRFGPQWVAERALAVLDNVLGAVAAAILATLLVVVLVNVTLRYLFHTGFIGAEDLGIWLNVAMIAVGAPISLKSALAMRLDTAAQLAALQPQAVLAVTGGVDFGQDESEGAIMARYLAQTHGLDPAAMVVEARSTSTVLNLEWTGPLLQQRGVDLAQPIAIVSSDFHLWRALQIARSQGFGQPIGVAAPTPLLTRFNVWLREYFAVASSWVLGEW